MGRENKKVEERVNFLTKDIQENNTEKRGSYELCFFYQKNFQIQVDKNQKYYIINYKEKLINNKEAVKILTIQQKVNMACSAAEISKTELGKRMGLSQSAFSQRLKTGKFSDEDFQNMAKAIGAKYYSGFEFPDGTKIE